MSTEAESVGAERSTLSALAVFVERRTLVMLALGFSAGLPFLLVFDTLSAWLRASGLSLEVIGFFSLVTMVYSFKFLWAPLIDRTGVPVLTTWLGLRGPCGCCLRHPGHRHRRMAHRGGGRLPAGCDGGLVSVGLPGGDARGGR